MGVINAITEVLSITFGLPVVQDVGQTYVEDCIAFEVQNTNVRTLADSSQSHQLQLVVTLRSSSGYDALGWMSQKLAAGPSGGEDWELKQVSGVETVDYETKGEIHVSLPLVMSVKLWHDQIKEKIQTIEWE